MQNRLSDYLSSIYFAWAGLVPRLFPSFPSYLKRFDGQRERWPIVVPFEIKLGGREKTQDTEYRHAFEITAYH